MTVSGSATVGSTASAGLASSALWRASASRAGEMGAVPYSLDRRRRMRRRKGVRVLGGGCGSRRRVGAAEVKGPNRLRDVLDALLAQVLERILPHLAHMVAHPARDADTPRQCQRFEARRDIDAVAEDIAVLNHDVADVDSDAELHAVFGRLTLAGDGEVLLDPHGAIEGVDDTRELCQHAVAGGPGDTALMLGNQRIDDEAQAGQRGQRRNLVALHVSAIAFDIGGENGDEPAFETGGFQVGLQSRVSLPAWGNNSPGALRQRAACQFVSRMFASALPWNIREDLQEISVRIAEEQRAMAKVPIRGWRNQTDVLPHEMFGAAVDFSHRDLEGELKGGRAGGHRSVLGRKVRPR